MSDYTVEELEQMLNDKINEENISASFETTEEATRRQILDAPDNVKYRLRDSSKFDKLVYSYEQSATIGKRVTNWMTYKPVVENGVTITYARTSVSESFSTNLNETFSQTGLIIED